MVDSVCGFILRLRLPGTVRAELGCFINLVAGDPGLALFALFQTVGTARPRRGGRYLSTATATRIVAHGATLHALGAPGGVARRAADHTAIAHAVAAGPAAGTVLVGAAAAVATRLAIPVIQGNEWTFTVVIAQDRRHELDRIHQPALFQRLTDRIAGIAGTQRSVADVRMRDAGITCRRPGLQGHDVEAPRTGDAQAVPVQFDGEFTQVNVFQRDCVRGDAQAAALPVDLHRAEFVFELRELQEQVGRLGCRLESFSHVVGAAVD